MKIGTTKVSFGMNVEQDFPNANFKYRNSVTKKFKHEYQYFQNGTTVTCISRHPLYEFKAIGIAKCNPKDKFDLHKGMCIAELRCRADHYKQLANFI